MTFTTMQGHQKGVKSGGSVHTASSRGPARMPGRESFPVLPRPCEDPKSISKGTESARGATPGESRMMNENDLLRRIDDLEKDLRRRERKIRRIEETAGSTFVSSSIRTSMSIPMLHLRNDAELIRGEISRLRGDPAREAIEDAERDLEKLYELIGNLERYSNLIGEFLESLRRGRWRLRKPDSPVDLNAVISRWVERIGTHPSYDGDVEIETRLNPYIPWISVRESDLFQIIYRLTENSFEALAGREGGRLTLGTDLEMDRVILSVIDNGPGIPAEIQASIFKPYFSTKRSENRGSGRCGMGLHTVSNIVRSAGGEIRLRSTEGIETVFEVLLPMQSADQRPPGKKPEDGGSVKREDE